MFENFKVVDLTHTLIPSIPTWDGSCGFQVHQISDLKDICTVQKFEMNAGIGTHMDSPGHFVKGGEDIASISLERLIVPLHVIDVSKKVDADYALSHNDVIEYESKVSRIKEGSLVAVYTGWSTYWHDVHAYRNCDKNGSMHFPKIDLTAAELLLKKDIVGIGIDTLSPDGGDLEFPVHHKVLGAGKYLVENLANLDNVPPCGAYALVMPLKIQGAVESPIRICGLVPLK